tara:strand:+ start:1771 stop:2436 length:666 start_codon:yes stop_codon:yes gene_type:complete
MKKIKAITLAFLLSLFGSSYALAEFTVGITGSMAMIDASGTELEGGETSSGDASNTAGVGSIFVEYNNILGTALSLGIDHIPGSADVSSSVKSRADANGEGDSGTNKAQAEVSDHTTVYLTYGFGNGAYAKLGYVEADLNTLETLSTGSKYGNVTIDGIEAGLGVEFDVYAGSVGRFELTHIAYDDISVRSSVARASVTPNNLIEADLDVTRFSASLGYKF